MTTFDDLVYGERVGELLPVLRNLVKGWRLTNDGMFELSGEFDAEVGLPIFRALTRAEAELLLEDADALGRGQDHRQRTSKQRSPDALVCVAEAVCALP
jgi:hypothetical protein